MTSQKPIQSGFGPGSTAADVMAGIDLSGKVPIVTGGYSGIGVETARALRSAGAGVIVPWRDLTIGGANQVKVFRRGATPELVATIPVGNPERYLVVTDMSDATQVVLRQSTPSTDH